MLAFVRHAVAHYRHRDGTPTGEFNALRPLRKINGKRGRMNESLHVAKF